MALIKCDECGKEMSDHAKACPNCGCENSVIFCQECGKKLSSKAQFCPECGYNAKSNNYNNNNYSSNDKGENYSMAIAAFICSFFIAAVGLILGIIVLNANKNKTNSARSFGLAAVIISGVVIGLQIIGMLIWIPAFISMI